MISIVVVVVVAVIGVRVCSSGRTVGEVVGSRPTDGGDSGSTDSGVGDGNGSNSGSAGRLAWFSLLWSW